jgi:hypothetical protein
MGDTSPKVRITAAQATVVVPASQPGLFRLTRLTAFADADTTEFQPFLGRRNMRSKGLRRTLTQLGIAILMAAGATLVSTSTASAGECDWYSPCGEVNNYSGQPLYVTTKLDDDETLGPHNCDVWNANGGTSRSWRYVSCFQEYLGPDSSMGGVDVDVDAFTYADRDYMVISDGKRSWHTKGVWTKIKSSEGAYCYTDLEFGFPKCLIEFE